LESASYLFSYLAFESVVFGKIKHEQRCLFCGSTLSEEQLKKMQTRLGRLQFLLRSANEGSQTAYDLLLKIFFVDRDHGGVDIPEDVPEWWDKAALEIYQEVGRARSKQEK